MDNYLIHYKKGSEKQDHKYVSRENKNGKWQYSYKSAEVELKPQKELEDNTAASPDQITSESKYYIDKDGLKRSVKTGEFTWNGESPEQVEEIMQKENSMIFDNDNDENHFNQMYRVYLANKKLKHSSEGGSTMDNNDQKYYYLAHGEKGSEWGKHLYTARKWVNGKWQYIYDNVNNALGADERARRDAANTRENLYGRAASAQRSQYRAAGGNVSDEFKNRMNKTRSGYEQAKNDAMSARAKYDKTVYGTIDRAKAAGKKALEAAKDKARQINDYLGADERKERNSSYYKYKKAAGDFENTKDRQSKRQATDFDYNRDRQAYEDAQERARSAQSKYDKTFYGKVDKAKDLAKAAGKKTMDSLGKAKDKAVAKGREVLASILSKRKSGKKG